MEQKYWKNQGNLIVQKCGNHGKISWEQLKNRIKENNAAVYKLAAFPRVCLAGTSAQVLLNIAICTSTHIFLYIRSTVV